MILHKQLAEFKQMKIKSAVFVMSNTDVSKALETESQNTLLLVDLMWGSLRSLIWW